MCNVLAFHYLHCAGQELEKVLVWQPLDLDHILAEGDKLYRTLNTSDLLIIEDFAHVIINN